jgi:hypothetical protein
MRPLLFTALAAAWLATSPPARACTPWVERVLAWDFDADLVVLQTWAERDRAPGPRVPPIGFELRRLSTGEELGARDCRLDPVISPCEFRVALGKLLPATAKWRQQGRALPRGLRVRAAGGAALRETALETRAAGGWRRLLWLSVTAAKDPERLQHTLKLYDEQGTDALLGFEVYLQGGNCPRTVVQALRVPRADLADPARAGRQAALMVRPRLDERFEHWRTIADLGPIPPGRLVEAMEAAEREDHSAFGVEWWRRDTRKLPPAEVEALAGKVRKSEGLYWTRTKLGL